MVPAGPSFQPEWQITPLNFEFVVDQKREREVSLSSARSPAGSSLHELKRRNTRAPSSLHLSPLRIHVFMKDLLTVGVKALSALIAI